MDTFKNYPPMLRRVFPALMFLSALALHSQEPADSLQHALDEVTVEASRQHVTPEKAVFIPEAKQKQASADAVSLLGRMSIPMLRVDALKGTVKTSMGQDVSIFIDFLPATSDDITGMRMKDVRRVEIYDYPTDVRFQGAEHVVNFIMQKYEYGGYGKFYNQFFAQDGDFTERPRANAKVSYKKMTYDVVVGGDIGNGKCLKSEEFSKFYFPQYNPPLEIGRDNVATQAGKLQYSEVYGTFRAVYNTEKMQISNSVGYSYFKQPHFDNHGQVKFSGIEMPSSETSNLLNRMTRAVAWNGNYYFALPHEFSLSANPSFNYSYNMRNERYIVDELTNIHNKAESKTTYGRLNLKLNKKLNSKVTLWMELSGSYNRNSVEYFGSNPGNVVLESGFFGPGVGMSLRLPKFYMTVDGGYAVEWNNTDDMKDRVGYPYVHLSTNYTFSDKLSWGTWTQFASNTPQAAERSPIMQQQNEFLWVSGNPDVTNSHHFTFNTWVNWMPSNIFQMSGYVYYFHLFDNLRRVYIPTVGGLGTPMMISRLANEGNYNQFVSGLNFTVKLLSNNLQLNAGPRFAYYSITGGGKDLKKPYVNWGAGANYYLNSFNFSAYYNSSSKFIGSQESAITWSCPKYGVGAGWANNDWSVQLYAIQFFAKNKVSSRTELDTPYYKKTSTLENGNYTPTFYCTLTYTFGFGKKIERGDEVKAVSGGADGILH